MSKSIKILFPFIIAFLVFFVIKNWDPIASNNSEETKNFSNDYFSVDYPRTWKLSKEGNNISIINSKSISGYKENVVVQIQESNFGKAPEADKLSDALVKNMSSYDDPYMSDFKMITSKIVTHQNYESAKVIAKFTARKANLDIISYYLLVPVGRNVFTLSYATPYSDSDNSNSDVLFEELLRTFEIK
ncbi:hypothetical protein [Paenibacillus motobuensis]